jgi:general secretion pathway protein M
MKPYLEQFLQWWNARLPRERQILIVGAVFVVFFILYSAIWAPLAKARHRAELDLQETRALANRLETVASEVERNRGSGGMAAATRGMPLLSAVDQASHRPELGKQYEKIEPDEGERTVKIWIDDVPFDSLVNWLNLLQTQYGIVVSTAELERKGEGLVNARLSLTRP